MNPIEMSSVLETVIGVSALSQIGSSLPLTDPENPLFWVLFLCLLVVIGFCIYAIVRARTTASNPNNIATIKDQQMSIFDSKFATEYRDKKSLRSTLQTQQVSDREDCLINFQPLTVIHPGYLGPAMNGVYDEKQAVSAVIRMGARCFVMPIDYHDRDTVPEAFPPANVPCLLYRDAGDTIRSLNGGSILKVAEAIRDVAWSDLVTQKNDPFILVLYFVRTPPENTREYLDFLSEVAKGLAPLSSYLLGQTPEGVYNRQARQDQLLFVNTGSLEKKLLIFCNTDTTGFRTSQTDFKRSYLPKEDLDYWVHLRLYKQNLETQVGVTSVPEQSGIPRGLVEMLSYYTTIPQDARNQRLAIDTTKQRFTIALSPPGTNPSQETVKMALDTYGVQAIPLFLTDYTPDVKTLMSNWKVAWRAKPKAIRYVRPEPQVIPSQSPRANANGGSVTVPS